MKSYIALLLMFVSVSPVYLQNFNCGNQVDKAEFLRGIWVGEFTQYSCRLYATYPMTFEINSIDNESFSGQFIYEDVPNAPNSRTTLDGEIIGESIFFYERSLISGEGIVLNGVYEVELLDCNTVRGNWTIKNLEGLCDDPQAMKDGGRFLFRKLGPQTPPQSPTAEFDDRKIIIKDEVRTNYNYITISLWDNNKEDGDKITLSINGKIALKDYTVKNEKREIILPLIERETKIILIAENLGDIPPNTAAISVSSGGAIINTTILSSDLNKSEGILIIRN